MSYDGTERRRHRVYMTRNTEYHVRDNVCVAVRDRKSLDWRPAHIALDTKLEGAVKIFANGAVIPNLEHAGPGDALHFSVRDCDGDARPLVTSRIETIDRPAKSIVDKYRR